MAAYAARKKVCATYGLLGDNVGRRGELHGLLLGGSVDLRHIGFLNSMKNFWSRKQ